jgi:hypothetical protein
MYLILYLLYSFSRGMRLKYRQYNKSNMYILQAAVFAFQGHGAEKLDLLAACV